MDLDGNGELAIRTWQRELGCGMISMKPNPGAKVRRRKAFDEPHFISLVSVSLLDCMAQDDLSITGASRSRLAYDELLASQLVLALKRQHARASIRPPSSVRVGSSCVPEAGVAQECGKPDSSRSCGLVEEGLRNFPFELTGSQKEGEKRKGIARVCRSIEL